MSMKGLLFALFAAVNLAAPARRALLLRLVDQW
jgi:hypothetical protein